MRFELQCSLERESSRNLKLTSRSFDSRVHDYALKIVFRTMLCINARNEVYVLEICSISSRYVSFGVNSTSTPPGIAR